MEIAAPNAPGSVAAGEIVRSADQAISRSRLIPIAQMSVGAEEQAKSATAAGQMVDIVSQAILRVEESSGVVLTTAEQAAATAENGKRTIG